MATRRYWGNAITPEAEKRTTKRRINDFGVGGGAKREPSLGKGRDCSLQSSKEN